MMMMNMLFSFDCALANPARPYFLLLHIHRLTRTSCPSRSHLVRSSAAAKPPISSSSAGPPILFSSKIQFVTKEQTNKRTMNPYTVHNLSSLNINIKTHDPIRDRGIRIEINTATFSSTSLPSPQSFITQLPKYTKPRSSNSGSRSLSHEQANTWTRLKLKKPKERGKRFKKARRNISLHDEDRGSVGSEKGWLVSPTTDRGSTSEEENLAESVIIYYKIVSQIPQPQLLLVKTNHYTCRIYLSCPSLSRIQKKDQPS